jgi:ACR3 family arsenite efflux pump ArsB
MKTERIVQLLFYLLLIIIVLGLIGYNSEPLIAPNIRNVLIYIILGFIIGFLFYYYIPKKKKH